VCVMNGRNLGVAMHVIDSLRNRTASYSNSKLQQRVQATSFLLCFHLSMYSGSTVCQFCKMSSEATPSNKQRTCIRFSYLAINSCISKLHGMFWRQNCSQCHGLPHPVSMTGLTTCISLSTVSFLALACSDLKTSGQCCSAACERYDAAQMAL